jgi:glycosyltransferase involved in cell wall biosynthesis
MKIVQVCGSSSWGGLEMMALQTSEELQKRGHEVFLFCGRSSRLFREGLKNGINAIEIFDNNKTSLSAIRKIKKTLRWNKCEIVHTHLSHDLWTLIPAMRGSVLKLFLTKHMDSFVSKKDIFHRYLYNKVTGIFAVSNYVKKSLIATCPVEPEKIRILHDFISTNKFDKIHYNQKETLKEYSIPKGNQVIGMVGRITPGKGHEDFINAGKIIINRGYHKVIFLIIGSASRGEEEYEKLIRLLANQSGISDKIIFIKHSEEIPKLMNIMDIFVMPSHEESFGIVLLEAMALELPVIATNNAGAKDIVKDNETGILTEPKNPQKLADKIIELINNSEKRDELGRNGRKRVEENFSSEKIIPKLLHYYITI